VDALKQQYATYPESKTGFLSDKQIYNGFKALDINISSEMFEYLIMCLYEQTENLKKLNINNMFEMFGTNEHKKVKEVMQNIENMHLEHKYRNQQQKNKLLSSLEKEHTGNIIFIIFNRKEGTSNYERASIEEEEAGEYDEDGYHNGVILKENYFNL